MQPAAKRIAIIRNGVMAGSVWEIRMKMDEVKGGIKLFNAACESRDDDEGLWVYRRLRRNQSECVNAEKKRKSWKKPELQRSPIQLKKALFMTCAFPSQISNTPFSSTPLLQPISIDRAFLS